jgi:hypothetical protein
VPFPARWPVSAADAAASMRLVAADLDWLAASRPELTAGL